MSSRSVFYIHVLVLIASIVVGTSESYSWLKSARYLIFAPFPLLLLSAIAPFVILKLAIMEGRSVRRRTLAFVLSVLMAIATFFAISPLCM
jgi:hypothetical protein